MDKEREGIRQEIFGKHRIDSKGETNPMDEKVEIGPEVNPELLKMFPPDRIERIKKKELRKYKAAQDKKWRNYLESVSK